MEQWVNSQDRFGWLSRGFHWLMAFIILVLLGVGFWMVQMPFGPEKFEIYAVHKSFGMMILGLGVMRLLWWITTPVPAHLPSHALWERFLSKTIHSVFYLSFVVMPLSGWVMSSAGEFSVGFFGLFEFPALTAKNEPLFDLAKEVHEVSAFILIGGIGLHILGALKHHILDRDETLKRMGGNVFIAALGVVLLVAPIFLAAQDIIQDAQSHKLSDANEVQADTGLKQEAVALPGDLQNWNILSQDSGVNFLFSQYGQDVSGAFEQWSGDIRFDPGRLEESTARIEIQIGSIKTGSDDRDEQARSADWFDAANYPKAVFVSESFEALEANRYVVSGVLDLHGVQMPVSFPFSLNISEGENGIRTAAMDAEFMLNRLDYNIGRGEWKSTEAIANSVKISVRVLAKAGASE